jgi:hypothetical protein
VSRISREINTSPIPHHRPTFRGMFQRLHLSLGPPSIVIPRGPSPTSSYGQQFIYTSGLLIAQMDHAPIQYYSPIYSASSPQIPVCQIRSNWRRQRSYLHLFTIFILCARNLTPTPALHSSYQNGQTERSIRTIKNSIRFALSFLKLSARYWDYAVLDAI